MKLKQEPTKRSSTGGAHIGFAMFGARGPLLEGADGAGGGAGGTKPPPAGQPPAGNPPPNGGGDGGAGGGEKLFTQADVDRITGERVARERNKGSGGGQQPPSKQQQSEQGATADDSQWMFEVSDALETVSEKTKVKPTPAAKKKLREDYRNAKPDDGVGFVETWFTNMGLIPASSAAAAGTNGQNGQQQTGAAGQNNNNAGDGKKTEAGKQGTTGNVPPLSNLGPPSGGPREFESITDPNELTKDDIDRLEAQLGKEKANGKIRELAERWASRTKLTVKPKR